MNGINALYCNDNLLNPEPFVNGMYTIGIHQRYNHPGYSGNPDSKPVFLNRIFV